MMYGILLGILILDGIFLGVVVLLQSGKGGGLAAMGGGAAATDGILGGRQATTMLTRATWTTGSVFMALSLILSIMSSIAQRPQSILRQDVTPNTCSVMGMSTPFSRAISSTGAQDVTPSAPAGAAIIDLLGASGDGDAGDGSAEPTEPPAGGDGND